MVVIGRELDDEEVPDEFPDVGHVPSNERNSFEELQVPSNESQRFVEESESRQELLEKQLVKYMSNMSAASADLCRATCAFHALKGCGQALRGRNDLHHLSFQTSQIQQFWSHSWHGRKWMKYCTVLFLQNGMIAIFVATLGSILAMLFVVLGFLPGYQAPTQSVFPGVNWCASSGLVLYCLTLFFWRRRFSIFLDVICIDQKDETRKAKGIISMGAILKSSDSILVLWDCSYSSRLWCVWELAAFLHSRQGHEQTPQVIIKPTSAGAAYLVQTLAVAVSAVIISSLPDGGRETRARASYVLAGIVGCCAYAVVAMSRAYFRNIDALWKELENFTTDKATCHCCTLGHAEAGQTCDRKILLQCISVWFGSVETFEQTVRTRVLDILANHLRHELFSYKSCLACTAPILWHFLDTLAGDLYYRESERHFDDAFFQTLRALGWWLGCIPAMFFTMLLLSRAFRNHCGMFIFEILTNVVVLLGVVASFVVMQGLEYLGWMCMEVVAGQGKQGWIAFLFFTPFVTMLAWCCFGCFHYWRPRLGQQELGGHSTGLTI